VRLVSRYLGLDFIVEELLLELGERVVAAVVVQVQRIQHVPGGGGGGYITQVQKTQRGGGVSVSLHHGGLLGLQDVVREDPGHGHLDGELDPATHGELQEELSEPQLGQVAALLQGLCTRTHTHTHTHTLPL